MPLKTLSLLLLLAATALLLPATARAQSCWVSGSANIDFGTVSASSPTDAQTNLGVACQASFNAPFGWATRFRICVFVGEGSISGMAPRRLSNYNGAYMNYDLYADAARTLLVGPPGSNYPVYDAAVDAPLGTIQLANMPLYGRVPAGQNLPATYPYQGHPAPSVVKYSYGYLFSPSEADCRNGTPGFLGGTGEASFGWGGVYAAFANTCRVVVATDLDFGNVGALTSNRDQTSTIELKCPTGTAWRVGLDNGTNASGSTRRMASGSNRISYELYRNNARSQRWGNTNGSDVSGTGNNAVQALTVYGRVPAQASPAGSYVDTVTVTLTY